MRLAVLVMLLMAVTAAPACIELQLLLTGQTPGGDDEANDNDNGSSNDNSGNDNDSLDGLIPRVALSVSNPAPQVNEEVILTCQIISGQSTGALFDFQPNSGRLIVNPTLGTASLIIAESDVGASFTFTCTAANEFGTSNPSTPRLIIPTSSALAP